MKPTDLTGLPLFDWLMKGSGEVVAFPVFRRAALVRETAARIVAQSTKADRLEMLDDALGMVERDLEAAGLDDNAFGQQLWDFQQAVLAECFRLRPAAFKPDPIDDDDPNMPLRYT